MRLREKTRKRGSKSVVEGSRMGRDERDSDDSRSVTLLSSFCDLLIPEGTSNGDEFVEVHETRLEGDHGFDGGEVGERVVRDREVPNGRDELGESFQRVGVGEFVVLVRDGDDLEQQERSKKSAPGETREGKGSSNELVV